MKQDGVWKIAGLHWFQTLCVPYEGGWQKNGDVNGGRFVGDRLKPDAPPSQQYKTWPGAFTPPFHFRGQYPGLLPLAPAAISRQGIAARAFAARQASLALRAQRLADQDTVENLQRIYGFYIDKGLWSEAAALFTDDAELEIQGRGVFRGRDTHPRLPAGRRPRGPAVRAGCTIRCSCSRSRMSPPTASTARGRWHLFAQLAQHGQFHEWADRRLRKRVPQRRRRRGRSAACTCIRP